jgi:hypothetical protein
VLIKKENTENTRRKEGRREKPQKTKKNEIKQGTFNNNNKKRYIH